MVKTLPLAFTSRLAIAALMAGVALPAAAAAVAAARIFAATFSASLPVTTPPAMVKSTGLEPVPLPTLSTKPYVSLPLKAIWEMVLTAATPWALLLVDAVVTPLLDVVPRAAVAKLPMATFMVWPAFSPICNMAFMVPSNKFLPLNCVVETMRSISVLRD